MMTSAGWCDTSIQYKVFQVLHAVLKESVTSKDMWGIIKKVVCKLARPLLFWYVCDSYCSLWPDMLVTNHTEQFKSN